MFYENKEFGTFVFTSWLLRRLFRRFSTSVLKSVILAFYIERAGRPLTITLATEDDSSATGDTG